jgi:hypothetical protein
MPNRTTSAANHARQRKARDIKGKVLSRISKDESGCWLWTGGMSSTGYGRITRDGRGRQVGAHRLSYEAFVGPIPEGMQVLHRCDVRRCVNPEHLFLGTLQDNMDDMHAKGRGAPFGHAPKLSSEDVLEIQRRAAAGEKRRDIARDFGIAHSLVTRIYAGKSHRRLTRSTAGGDARPRGEKRWNAKLTEEQVVECVRLFETGAGDTEIARMFNVRRETVRQIRQGRTWKHVARGASAV